MNLKQYQQLCKQTAKQFDTKTHELSSWGLGICGEAGDLAGCIKKTLFHTNDQTKGVRENLGDVLWYAAMICNAFNWDLEEVMQENIEKLKQRFPQGFTEECARRKGTRTDWMERSHKIKCEECGGSISIKDWLLDGMCFVCRREMNELDRHRHATKKQR